MITKTSVVTNEQIIRFFHPSYSQSLSYLLEDPIVNSNFKKVFNNVISKLSSIHESKDSVLRVIAENFDYLNNEEKQILLNDSNGKLLLFYYKMLQGPLGMGDYTRNVPDEAEIGYNEFNKRIQKSKTIRKIAATSVIGYVKVFYASTIIWTYLFLIV